jgi:hypothetical protein
MHNSLGGAGAVKAEKKKAQHSSASPEYGTPDLILKPIRVVFGGQIDMDPCTSELFNEVVQAKNFYTAQDNGLDKVWLGNTLVNSPSDISGNLIKKFWEKLIREYACGNVKSAFWIGFNIEHLAQLQNTKVDANPYMFPTCIPHKRIRFNETQANHQVQLFDTDDEQLLIETDRPAHANFVTFLPDRRKTWQVEIFRREFAQIGQVKV